MCLKRLAWDGVLLALSFSAGAQTVTDGDTIELAGVTYVAGTVDQELLARNEYLQDGSKVMFVGILQRRRQIQNAGLRAPMTFPRPA